MPVMAAYRRPRIETKLQVLDLVRGGETGAFAGYASIFEEEDLGRDVIARGAFAESLRVRGAQGVKLLFQHDPNEVIGLWTRIGEDRKGLFVEGRLNDEVVRAREILALMRMGALDGLSIGFRAVAGRRDAKSGVRRLTKIDLWEISIVTFPMLPDARVTAVKRHDPSPAARIREAARLMRCGL